MAVLRELVTKLGFDADQKTLDKYEGGVNELKKSLLKIVAISSAVSTALFGMANSAAKVGDELDKTRDLVGLTAKDFQSLTGAAALAGVEQQGFTTALQLFNRTIGMARQGMQESLKPFQMLGISLRDSSGNFKDQSKLILEVADKFSKLTNVYDKTAVAQELFGRSGGRLINFFNKGSAGIQEMQKEFEKYAFVLSDKAIKQSVKFRDDMFLAESSIKGLKNAIGVALLPEMTKLIKAFLDWFAANKKIITLDLVNFFEGVSEVIKSLFFAVKGIADLFSDLWGNLSDGSKTIAEITAALFVLDASIGLIPASIIAVLLVIQDIATYFQGGDSITGRLLGHFPKIKGFIDGLAVTIGKVKDVLMFFIVDPLKLIISLLEKIFSYFDKFGSMANFIKSSGSALSVASSKIGISNAASAFGVNAGAFRSPLEKAITNSNSINVNTTVNMQAPVGSTDEQQQGLEETATNIFNRIWDENMQKTLVAFPNNEY